MKITNHKINNNLAHQVTYLSASDKVCPICGSNHIQNISRITGYLSLDERFGGGKIAEKLDRVAHNCDSHCKVYSK